jgi:RNA-binding protein
MDALLPAWRRELRARAHHLHSVVAIGHHGLTPAVLHEIDVALTAHELIKVRVANDDRGAREALLARICDELACSPVQHLGKLLVVWRARPAEEKTPPSPRARKSPRAPTAPRERAARPPHGKPAARGRFAGSAPEPPVRRGRAPSAASDTRPRTGKTTTTARAPAGVPRAGARRRRRAG